MRVLERESPANYSMGKKNKHKLARKSKERDASDSSEEVSGRGCSHVSKSVNFSSMKKGLAKQAYGECLGCSKESSSKKGDKPLSVLDNLEGATSSDFSDDVEQVLWVCLQCGNQGCGRNSTDKHALKHYETPRSTQHNVVINTSSWSAWCYACDDEVQADKHKKVAECMEHLKKIACVTSQDSCQGKNSGYTGGADAGTNKGRPQSAKGSPATNSMCQKVKGLSNLGNTCFFNAVMQNLIQTYSLENLLGERKKGLSLTIQPKDDAGHDSLSSSDEAENEEQDFKDLPVIEINTSDPGPLTQALVVFLHEMYYNSRSSIINPSALFGQVCKKAPRFKGMQQQDSHELLRYLLDNMKTEEIKRGQRGVLKHFKLTENANPKKVDEDTKMKVKAYGADIKHTFVECLFGGQLISTVVCEECKYISQVLEPFLDLSLPVTEEKRQRPNPGFGGRKKSESETKDDAVVAKGDKTSKHQLKKQKKKQKRDSRRQNSKSKTTPGDDDDGQEDNDGDGKDEEADDKDEEGKSVDQERDASDADVEDNLESDTSRCYGKNLSDSVMSAMDDSGVVTASNGPCGTIVSDQPTCLTVEATIENHSIGTAQFTVENSVVAGGTTTATVVNGPVTVSHTGKTSDFNVSYTLHENGCLTEENSFNGGQNVATSVILQNDSAGQNHMEMDTEKKLGSKIDRDSSTCMGNTENSSKGTVFTGNSSKCMTMTGDTICNGYPEPVLETSVDVTELTGDTHTQSVIEDCHTNTKELLDPVSHLSTHMAALHIDKSSASGVTNGVERLTLGGDAADCVEQKHNAIVGDGSAALIDNIDRIQTNIDKSVSTGDIEQPGMAAGDGDKPSVKPECPDGTATVQASAARQYRSMKELRREGQRQSVNTLVDRYHPSSGECSIESCLHQFTAAELLTGNNKFGCKNCTKRNSNNPNKGNKDKKEVVYSNANKQFLVFQPPAVLTLHLKRFEQVGFSSRKVNRHVEFPFVLDLAPYCSSLTQGIKPGQKKLLYSLYGVVEHTGRLTSGHYTAYVKVRPNIGTLNSFLNSHYVSVKEYLNKYAESVMNSNQMDSETAEDVNTDKLVPPGRWFHISDSSVSEVTEASVERAQAYLLFYERIF